jgi:hypothetical protein
MTTQARAVLAAHIEKLKAQAAAYEQARQPIVELDWLDLYWNRTALLAAVVRRRIDACFVVRDRRWDGNNRQSREKLAQGGNQILNFFSRINVCTAGPPRIFPV